jgi:cytochrome c oxidase assembly factor CtaG
VWSLQPALLASVTAAGGVYWWRFAQLVREGGPSVRTHYLRAASFAAGLLVLAVAFVSPLDHLGEERLFVAHMAQHLLLTDVAPILLLLGLSRALLRPLTRRFQPLERRLDWVAHPVTAVAALVLVLWAWHVPALYDLSLRSGLAHAAEHAMFFWAGIAFWWYVIEPLPPRHRLRGAGTVAYVGAAKLLLGALGVALAFAPSAFYDAYEQAPRTWGLSPVDDQNVGGLLMMTEQTLVLVIFFAILFARMIDQSEQAQRRRERFGTP